MTTSNARWETVAWNSRVKTGVRHGCVMSALLFNIIINWVMHCTTEDKTRGLRWTLFSALEDLGFAEDLALGGVPHSGFYHITG